MQHHPATGKEVSGWQWADWLVALHVGHSLTNATTMSPRRNLESRSLALCCCCWERSSRICRRRRPLCRSLLSSSPSLLALLLLPFGFPLLLVVSVLLMCCSVYPSLDYCATSRRVEGAPPLARPSESQGVNVSAFISHVASQSKYCTVNHPVR